ncbi:MAG: hypothetical protein GTO45_21885 [Candidatus Aminicenantes bacterium]|nr:hypothetical protein [Candidatus Aminicenantes bacterium]NIN87416.1 hypothetical protein [Candidatus Aminicenantes bacterium]NIQ69654.1 hypothetical protein [Candidatus Aminicenantes bacterium]NIR08262.1 hypothetical protein [Candidatus Aminicenantes bacterium]
MSISLRYRMVSRLRKKKNKSLKIGEIVKRRLEAEQIRVPVETLEGIEFGVLTADGDSGIHISKCLPKPVETERLTAAQMESLSHLQQNAQENGFDVEIVSTAGTSPIVCVKIKKSETMEAFEQRKALPAPSTEFLDFTDLFDSKPDLEKIPLRAKEVYCDGKRI